MGRGFESHRGHEKESQMTCNEPFGFFVFPDVDFVPAGANANYANYTNNGAEMLAPPLLQSQVLCLSHATERNL